MSKQELSWIGLRVDDLIVDSLIANGAFSAVYHGNTLDFASERLVKVAKSLDVIQGQRTESLTASTARALLTGVKLEVRPDACELLQIQFATLGRINHPAVLKPMKLFAEEGLVYYQMDPIKGHTLQETLKAGSAISLAFMAELCEIVHHISSYGFAHGDLKPANIFLTDSGPVLIDPGYFGPLNTENGRYEKIAVTTPAYYPSFQCDDLYALGIIFFELACRVQPFLLEQTDPAASGKAGPNLLALIKRYSMTGNYNFKSLSKLNRPCEYNPSIKSELETVLLKAVRIKFEGPSNLLQPDPGYSNAGELASEIRKLMKMGIELQ